MDGCKIVIKIKEEKEEEYQVIIVKLLQCPNFCPGSLPLICNYFKYAGDLSLTKQQQVSKTSLIMDDTLPTTSIQKTLKNKKY